MGKIRVGKPRHVCIKRDRMLENDRKCVIGIIYWTPSTMVADISKMVADISTKPLSRMRFERHRCDLNIRAL